MSIDFDLIKKKRKEALEKDRAKGLEYGDHFVGFCYWMYNYLEKIEKEVRNDGKEEKRTK